MRLLVGRLVGCMVRERWVVSRLVYWVMDPLVGASRHLVGLLDELVGGLVDDEA